MIPSATRVSGLLAATRNAGASDAELLDRFVAERDGPAFAALVARHGTMVFGVCRRVVRDWHLAEDAFQATFLVLARRAATVSPPEAVAGWLHGVAYRVAKSAQRTRMRRTERGRPTGDALEPAAPPAPETDLRDAIDGEVQKLPRKYRDLIVACDLEERDRRSVAAALGIPEGTLSSRLTAARKMLAERLARRGVGPASAALVALGGPSLVACEVPRRVLASAAQLGCGAPGTVPVGVPIPRLESEPNCDPSNSGAGGARRPDRVRCAECDTHRGRHPIRSTNSDRGSAGRRGPPGRTTTDGPEARAEGAEQVAHHPRV